MLIAVPLLASEVTGSIFNPLSVSGCLVWLRADTLVLNNNDPVGSWPDSSPTGNTFEQATAGNKPLFKTNIINGLPTVLFDGVDDWMQQTAGPANIVQPLTGFVVSQPTLNTASQKNYATMLHTTQAGLFMVAKITTSFWGTFTTGTGDLSSTNALTSGSNYLLENTATTSSTFLYQRGSQVATRAETEVGSGGGRSAIGKDIVNANRQYAGHIAEVIVYNTVLSSADRVNVENYLISKYAL